MIEDIGFNVEALGKHSDDEKREHYLYRVTLTYQGRTFSTDYRMGVGCVELKPANHMADPKRQAERLGGEFRYNALGPGKDAIAVPRPPTLLDVLGSLRSDCTLGDQLFEDFCGDLGYDTDSRKAHASWEACQRMHYELRNLFGYGAYQTFIDTDWEELECSSS